jgi:hypothetical protein
MLHKRVLSRAKSVANSVTQICIVPLSVAYETSQITHVRSMHNADGSFAISCGRLSRAPRVTLSLRFPDLRRDDLSGRALADIPQNTYTTGLRAARPIKQVMCRCRVRCALLNQSNKNEVI